MILIMHTIIYTTKNEKGHRVNVYKGRALTQLKEIRERGETPLSIEDIIRQRLIVNESHDVRLENDWFNLHFNTCDTIREDTKGNIELVRGSQTLLSIYNNDDKSNGRNKSSRLYDGAIRLPQRVFGNEGKIFIRDKIDNDTFWLELVQGNEELFRAYEKLAKEKCRKGLPIMRVLIDETAPDYEIERPLIIDPINCGRSHIIGNNNNWMITSQNNRF